MGSLVKPFVYLTALETKRYNATTVIQDEPIDVKLQNGTHWKPQNFTKEIYGPVPLVRALSELAESRDGRARARRRIAERHADPAAIRRYSGRRSRCRR